MVKFQPIPGTLGSYKVLVDGKQLGCINKRGFFTDPIVGPKGFVEVSPDDLEKIAAKAREVQLAQLADSPTITH